jgi:hypothetical protein
MHHHTFVTQALSIYSSVATLTASISISHSGWFKITIWCRSQRRPVPGAVETELDRSEATGAKIYLAGPLQALYSRRKPASKGYHSECGAKPFHMRPSEPPPPTINPATRHGFTTRGDSLCGISQKPGGQTKTRDCLLRLVIHGFLSTGCPVVEISLLYKFCSTVSTLPLHSLSTMDTSIQFAGDNQRSRKASASQGIGGVVPLRHRSLSRKRTRSVDVHDKIAELDDAEDEDAGLRDERDYKRRQVHRVRDLDAVHANTRQCRTSACARFSYWPTSLSVSSTETLEHRLSTSTRPHSQKHRAVQTCWARSP